MTAIERQRELLAEATPGPWEERTGGRWFAVSLANRAYVYALPGEPNAALIVAAVNDRAALLDVVEAADELNWKWEGGDANISALRAALDRLHALPGWEE